MTQNEKIAAKMGWKYEEREYAWGEKFIWMGYGPSSNRISLVNPDFCTMPLAKLLQARMVADGWSISIYHWKEELPGFTPKIYFSAHAFDYSREQNTFFADTDSEPAALHALFCKVYNIGGEG